MRENTSNVLETQGSSTPAAELQLSVIVPTFNEAANVSPMIDALHQALDNRVAWEVVFVDDDSPDGTAEIAKAFSLKDQKVRCLHRIGRRGLSSACVEGILASAAPFVAVIDGDLQHDERILPKMLAAATEGADLVVGTRYMEGGSTGDWSAGRVKISRFATKIAKIVTKTDLSDPMSGFFLLSRLNFNTLAPNLSSIGFKILLDICASSKRVPRVAEVPYRFKTRQHGDSKLDGKAVWEFLMLLADKMVGKYIPIRFLSFAIVGGSGVIVHIAVFSLFFSWIGTTFLQAKIFAVGSSIISNYLLNNSITYRDKRLQGWSALVGLLTFALVCSIGSIADIGISSYLFGNAEPGSFMERFAVIPAAAGILVGVVWNYTISSIYTWNAKK